VLVEDIPFRDLVHIVVHKINLSPLGDALLLLFLIPGTSQVIALQRIHNDSHKNKYEA
jgi:hypothetical protein